MKCSDCSICKRKHPVLILRRISPVRQTHYIGKTMASRKWSNVGQIIKKTQAWLSCAKLIFVFNGF
jgi:hypothetical protein